MGIDARELPADVPLTFENTGYEVLDITQMVRGPSLAVDTESDGVPPDMAAVYRAIVKEELYRGGVTHAGLAVPTALDIATQGQALFASRGRRSLTFRAATHPGDVPAELLRTLLNLLTEGLPAGAVVACAPASPYAREEGDPLQSYLEAHDVAERFPWAYLSGGPEGGRWAPPDREVRVGVLVAQAAERCVDRRLGEANPLEPPQHRERGPKERGGELEVVLPRRDPARRGHASGYCPSRSNVPRCSATNRSANAAFFADRARGASARRAPQRADGPRRARSEREGGLRPALASAATAPPADPRSDRSRALRHDDAEHHGQPHEQQDDHRHLHRFESVTSSGLGPAAIDELERSSRTGRCS